MSSCFNTGQGLKAVHCMPLYVMDRPLYVMDRPLALSGSAVWVIITYTAETLYPPRHCYDMLMRSPWPTFGCSCFASFVLHKKRQRSAGTYISYLTQSVYIYMESGKSLLCQNEWCYSGCAFHKHGPRLWTGLEIEMDWSVDGVCGLWIVQPVCWTKSSNFPGSHIINQNPHSSFCLGKWHENFIW